MRRLSLTGMMLLFCSIISFSQDGNVLYYPDALTVLELWPKDPNTREFYILEVKSEVEDDYIIYLATIVRSGRQVWTTQSKDNNIVIKRSIAGTLIIAAYAVNDSDPVYGLCPLYIWTKQL